MENEMMLDKNGKTVSDLSRAQVRAVRDLCQLLSAMAKQIGEYQLRPISYPSSGYFFYIRTYKSNFDAMVEE